MIMSLGSNRTPKHLHNPLRTWHGKTSWPSLLCRRRPTSSSPSSSLKLFPHHQERSSISIVHMNKHQTSAKFKSFDFPEN